MKNLSLQSLTSSSTPSDEGSKRIVSVVFDVDNDGILTVSESVDPETAQVTFHVWTHSNTINPRMLAIACTPASFATGDSEWRQLVNTKLLPDTRTLCIISAAGDILTGVLESSNSPSQLESVGSVESGIKAAAWSPDDEVLVLITGEDNLLQMTRDFDVITESPLRKSELGEEQAVNVGWGSKQTQFHGSLGKTAAAASGDQAVIAARGGSSPDDDLAPRISWRGDGQFFVVSSLDPHPVPPPTPEPFTQARRILRVYDRSGVHQTTSEPTPGLEHSLSWRPSGNLIASVQRFGFPGGGQGNKGRQDVVFYERNGLRHGEFSLREKYAETPEKARRWGHRVRELAWNSDSTILAVWIERDDGDVVQLWTTGNYHWYLKQEIRASVPEIESPSPARFTAVAWHPEQALRLIATSHSQVDDYRFVRETCTTSLPSPSDTATVAVVDGSTLLMTPFRLQNVPPPMSSYKIDRDTSGIAPPIHLSLCPNVDALVLLYPGAQVELWLLNTAQDSKTTAANPAKLWTGEIPGNFSSIREVLAWRDDKAPEEWFIAILAHPMEGRHDAVVVAAMRHGVLTDDYETSLPATGKGRILYLEGGELAWEAEDGQVLKVDFENELTVPLVSLPEFCPQVHTVQGDVDDWSVYALAPSGKLYAANSTSETVVTLATNCTSFILGSGFLIYTTSAHYSHYAPLDKLYEMLQNGPEGAPPEWEQRRVERGSRIVTVVPSAMSLVLQMPRGNLETINPRPLVLAVVRQDIDAGDYRKALLACRKHRIDLNVLVDHNPEAFMLRLSSFTEQIHEVDYINLFLSGIGQSKQEPKRISQICDAIREELERKGLKKYVNSILTAHVVKTPPDLEASLSLLLRLKETDPTLVEDAVKYIIFLVDADKLFDTALGMYDFSLVLLVAQHSPKKDPREYLPFLRDLRDAGDLHGLGYQKFKIDDYLKKYEKALWGLHEAGSAKFDEAMAYVEKHRLYQEALRIWANETDARARLMDIYGEHLFERREFRQAALAGKPQRAMVSYEKAHMWQEQFALAVKEGMSFDELSAIGQRVAEELVSRKRYNEAGRVLLDYCKNVDEAIAAFGQGGDFPEAERVCALESRMDLIETILHPAAFENRDQLGEDIEEITEQLTKQSSRLKELREKKATDPDAFYNPEFDRTNLQNVDVMTDAASTVAGTTFTRYTMAPSATSKKSKGSAKTRRKAAMKKGKKGTVEEEEYILLSIAKMPARVEAIKVRTSRLLPYLLTYTADHQTEGAALQKQLGILDDMVRKAIDDAWAEKDEDEEEPERLPDAHLAMAHRSPPLPRKPEPIGVNIEWKVNLF